MASLLRRRDGLIRKPGAMCAALALSLLILVCTAAFSTGAASSAPANADPQPFVGTWQAKFDGKVFQIVTLELKNGKLTGSVSRGHIELNDEGGMTAAELKEGSDPIVDAKLKGNVLNFITTSRSEAANAKPDTDTFEMTLTGKDEATISPVDDEIKKEMPKFKPWKLERVKAVGDDFFLNKREKRHGTNFWREHVLTCGNVTCYTSRAKVVVGSSA